MTAVIDPAIGAICVAAIAAIGGVASALAAAVSRRDIRERIGEPNGQGNLVEMMTRLLAGQTGQDTRIAKLEATQLEHAIHIAAHDERLRAVERPHLTD